VVNVSGSELGAFEFPRNGEPGRATQVSNHMRVILVGGFKHFLFSIIYGMSSFPLTNSVWLKPPTRIYALKAGGIKHRQLRTFRIFS
jgi:hypothetical protein